MQEAPQVTVLMPVYNAQDYLIDAMASIVEQSFQDWEMICVNDGSRDQSGEMLDWFAAQDQRIRVVHQANQGLVGALNVGIELSRGHYIMRMDNDDIAMTDRMQKQLDYMNSHPECVVLAEQFWKLIPTRIPWESASCLRSTILFSTSFCVAEPVISIRPP